MKKLFSLLLFLTISLASVAQTYYYKATDFAYKYYDGYRWTEWSDWKPCSIKMKIDVDDDMIVIYSNTVQVYSIIEYLDEYTDSSGGKQVRYSVIDQDYDRGHIRLRIEKSGSSQIYVDFNDLMWVYNVTRLY